VHTCPSKGRKTKTKLAKTRWVADAVIDWLREKPSLGPTTLQDKIFEKYKINIPYMRVFYGKEHTLESINGPWNDSFQLFYTFKAKVEMASPGSVVEIDKHTVQYTIRGKTMEKECFRRAFVCFKACSQGFLDGCRPYLAVDATTLNGRFKGQLVAACAVDGHKLAITCCLWSVGGRVRGKLGLVSVEFAQHYRSSTRIGYQLRCLQRFGECSRSSIPRSGA